MKDTAEIFGSERGAPPQDVQGLEKTGLTTAVSATQDVKARTKVEPNGLQVTNITDF